MTCMCRFASEAILPTARGINVSAVDSNMRNSNIQRDFRNGRAGGRGIGAQKLSTVQQLILPLWCRYHSTFQLMFSIIWYITL
jgi:hypothetical protein